MPGPSVGQSTLERGVPGHVLPAHERVAPDLVGRLDERGGEGGGGAEPLGHREVRGEDAVEVLLVPRERGFAAVDHVEAERDPVTVVDGEQPMRERRAVGQVRHEARLALVEEDPRRMRDTRHRLHEARECRRRSRRTRRSRGRSHRTRCRCRRQSRRAPASIAAWSDAGSCDQSRRVIVHPRSRTGRPSAWSRNVVLVARSTSRPRSSPRKSRKRTPIRPRAARRSSSVSWTRTSQWKGRRSTS